MLILLFFLKVRNSNFTSLLIYVDDIVLVGNDQNEINSVKICLNTNFKIKYLGKLRCFLGLEIYRSDKGIYINQRKYTFGILEDTATLAS